jgi:hypothetical protein
LGPLPDARVDVWHADATGCYSAFPEQEGCAEPTEASSARLRGTFMADAQGQYAFNTIRPAMYGDPTIEARAAHIHFRVRLAAEANSSVDLFTQLYFQGTTYLEEDDGAEDAFYTSGYQRIIERVPRVGGGYDGVFNIVLPGPASSIRRGPRSLGEIRGFDIMVLRNGRDMRFLLPPGRLPGTVFLRVTAMDGRECHASSHPGREVRWDASRMPPGVYTAQLRSTHSRSRESVRLVF